MDLGYLPAMFSYVKVFSPAETWIDSISVPVFYDFGFDSAVPVFYDFGSDYAAPVSGAHILASLFPGNFWAYPTTVYIRVADFELHIRILKKIGPVFLGFYIFDFCFKVLTFKYL